MHIQLVVFRSEENYNSVAVKQVSVGVDITCV